MSVSPPVSLGRTTKSAICLLLVGAVSLVALGGCPIYADDDCSRGRCEESACRINSDCVSGYVCSSANRCVAASQASTCTTSSQCEASQTCGRDGYCHVQDCMRVGCAEGVCVLAGGIASCQRISVADASSDPGGCTGMGTRGSCAAGSLCVANRCYVSCGASVGTGDGGADAAATDASASDAGEASDACTARDAAQSCKTVVAYGMSLSLCGATNAPGGECGGDAGTCGDAGICIDGYCR